MALFNRSCKVVFVPPTEPPDAIEIKDLAMSFKIFKTTTRTSNTLDLEIFNLSQNTRNKILKLDTYVAFYAGYIEERNEKILFIGDVTKGTTVFELPEIKAVIEAGDGQKILRETRVSVSFREQISAKKVLEEVASKLQAAIRDYSDASDISYEHGFSFVGPAGVVLDKVTAKLGAEWSIQNGELQLLKKKQPAQNDALEFSPNSGMLKSPERIDDIGGNLAGERPMPGWRIVSLLNPMIEPGMLIKLTSREIEGFFRVETVTHEGQTHEETWTSTLEVSELNPPNIPEVLEEAAVEVGDNEPDFLDRAIDLFMPKPETPK